MGRVYDNDWLKVGERYLPLRVDGVPVLLKVETTAQSRPPSPPYRPDKATPLAVVTATEAMPCVDQTEEDRSAIGGAGKHVSAVLRSSDGTGALHETNRSTIGGAGKDVSAVPRSSDGTTGAA